MRRVVFCAAAALVALVSLPSAQQADKVKAASDYLGAGNMKSVRFTGFGANYTVGQAFSPGEAWPKVEIKSYDAQINYETGAMQVDLVREMGPTPPRGGGVPFVGEQRQSQFVVGTVAWDVPVAAAPAGGRGRGGAGRAGGAPAPAEPGRVTLQEALAFAGIRPPAPPITPQPAAGVDRMLQIYLTPHGFLRAAAANNATTRTVPAGTEVTFTLQGKYKLTGLINARNEVEKVSTITDNPVLGDMPIEVTYSNYQKTDADTWFPLRIVQRTGGQVSFELWISSVNTNPAAPTGPADPRNAAQAGGGPLEAQVPDAAKAATIPPVTVTAEKIGDGIFYLTGGTHHSVAIEMRDHVILVEAPQSEARSTAVIAKVKETIPGKPIKYVVNTHVHFDHSGGLRTLVNEGATVVTQQANKAFYQKAWAQPHTLNPDLLSQSKKVPTFLTFVDKQVLTDGKRTVEVHRILNSNHNDGFAMVYVPSAKLLIEADAYTVAAAPPAGQGQAAGAPRGGGAPPAGGAPAAAGGRAGAAPAAPAAPAGPNPETVNLYANIQRLKLDVAQIAGLHGRLATIDELKTAAAPAPAAGTAGQ